MNKNPLEEHTRLLNLVSNFRWTIPLLVAVFGGGYILFERMPTSGDILRAIWFSSLVVPLLCWVLLTWLTNVAQAAINEHRELAFQDRELVVLNTIGEVAGQSLNLETMLQVALERIVELLGLPAGEICTFDSLPDTFSPETIRTFGNEPESVSLHSADGQASADLIETNSDHNDQCDAQTCATRHGAPAHPGR